MLEAKYGHYENAHRNTQRPPLKIVFALTVNWTACCVDGSGLCFRERRRRQLRRISSGRYSTVWDGIRIASNSFDCKIFDSFNEPDKNILEIFENFECSHTRVYFATLMLTSIVVVKRLRTVAPASNPVKTVRRPIIPPEGLLTRSVVPVTLLAICAELLHTLVSPRRPA